MTRRWALPSALFAAVVVVFSALPAAAQCVSLTTLGSASTQNFDTLSNTAGSTTNNLTITGWFLTEGGGGARDNEQYAVDTGTSPTGDMYSYGAAGSTERALGQLRSGTLIPLFGACFTNNTGATIGSLGVAFNGEEWRLGTAGRNDQLNFEYSTNATDLVTGTWTNVSALNFVTPDTATTGAKNGNAAADRTALSSTISSLSIANGATFWIRFNDTDASGADDGLAVDDFSLTPQGVITLPNLTINDVSLNEGNAGTTSFTFTVSLSAPAGPGGVTFDIATADGTATQPGDYTQKSLTSQTIPAGSSTYSFTVLVNGDVTPETNETFFVNVTNVTGATVTDGQGQGTIVNDDAAPNLTINDVTLAEGNAGTTTFTFTVSLSAPAGAGGVTFDIATADNSAVAPGDYTAKSLTSQTIPAGSSTYTFDVLVNGDTTPETDETFNVNVTNVTNAIVTDGQGVGTITNDDLTKIHDVQGNGSSSPLVAQTVAVEGVVTANFQGSTKLQGFFLQEEDADNDADPATSEGIFIFCSSCPTAVAEGQRVRATGTVSEFNSLTEITASTAGAVVITDAGNHLAEVTPVPIDLPVVAPDINAFYEQFESMKVTFVDSLSVSEYFELFRYGQIELYEGGRPYQFTEHNPPSVAGYAAQLDALARRRVILDDDNNVEEAPLGSANGFQAVFYPRANGGFSVGTQGTDFFRGADLISGLTGILHYSFSGGSSPNDWRVRPTAANPASFTVANPRPATPPNVGGAIRAVGMNMLNFFTTIDTTSSNNSGPCGPSGTQDCRGADSVAELNRQRERAALVICTLNPDVAGLMEMENTTATTTINDLLGAVNTSCGGAHPYTFVNTGGTLGTDAIRVFIIYRTGVVSPVGSALVDLDPIHNRPPTAQTFDVVDAVNPAFGQRFTFIANHFKSKGCPGTGADADANDGQGCYNGTRVAQANRLLTWVNGTVIPAAGDPDVLMVGDFNSYANEDPVTALEAGGYTDLTTQFVGSSTYSYLFDGQLGHLDYGFASASMLPQVHGADDWHINADEVPLFDYSDEVKDTGESTFEEKPDGSALAPPRVVFQPSSPYRASDHDPVVLGLFAVADVAITKTDSPDPVNAGDNLTYTITIANNGPDPADNASWSDTLPAGTTFVSLSPVAGWSCTTPAVGASGTVSCSNSSFAVSSAPFTLVVNVDPSTASGTVLSNTATATSTTGDPTTGNESATATTTVATSADLALTKTDSPDPVNAGDALTYTITVTNNGPSNAASVSWSDTIPAGTTFVSLTSPGGWSCTTPAVGTNGTITCSIASLGVTNAAFTLVVDVAPSTAAATVLSNTATVSSTTTDPNSGNESGTATTTVATAADLQVTKADSPDPVTAGNNITYTLTLTNNGPSDAAGVTFSDTLPANTTFVSLTTFADFSCTTPAVGGTGAISCSKPSTFVAGTSGNFTLVVNVDPATADGTIISNTATVASTTTEVSSGDNSDTASTTVGSGSADLSISKSDSPDPVIAGNNLTYTITVTNAGPSNASTVSMSDTLPTGTTFVSLTSPGGWSCTTPAVGATGTVSCSIASLGVTNAAFTLVVNVDPAILANLSNTATVTSATSDSNSANNSVTENTTVNTQADVQVTKTDSPDPISAGSLLTYTITVTNNGPSAAANVSLSDTIPANTVYITSTPQAGWSCSTPGVGGTGTYSCSIASLAPGASAVFTVNVTVNASTPTGTVITNTATVSTTTTDSNSGNNSATATTTVSPVTNFTATKAVSGSFIVGGTVTYTVVLTNNMGHTQGDNFANEFADILPSELTLVSANATSGTTGALVGPGIVTWNGSIPNGGSVTITITATIDAGASGTISNQGNAIIDTDNNGLNETGVVTDDPSTAAPNDPTSFTVIGTANVSGTKTASGTFAPGGSITYTIVLSNTGTGAQGNNPGDELVDVLPSSLTLVSASATSGTALATIGTNTVTWNGAIAAGGSVTITINATINSATPVGTSITNQGTINYDGDGNGTNESTRQTDSPAAGGSSDATTFVVGAAATAQIPTLDEWALIALAILIAAIAIKRA